MIRALDRWLPAYLTRDRRRGAHGSAAPLEVFIAVCDHFEPFHDTDRAGALRAMTEWENRWPLMVGAHRDSSGRGPRHTFFFPIEQYDEEIISRLAALCRKTGSEIEVHLHHEGDTAESLAAKLREGVALLARHGALSRAPDGAARYGFIHGNWALDHSHPAGRHCGVPDELRVLRATGCYADFTLPSAPDPSQTRTINAIYYAHEDGLPRSHETGAPVAMGKTEALSRSPDHLLIVQGPLGLNWRRRKWGLLPRVENADLTGANPPTAERFHLWTRLCPMVAGGPDWMFVKLHTHGGIPRNHTTLLGDACHRFHRDIASIARASPALRYHYVTAREMVNLIHAAEHGRAGDPASFFDHVLPPPPL